MGSGRNYILEEHFTCIISFEVDKTLVHYEAHIECMHRILG